MSWTTPARLDVDPKSQIATVDHFDVGIGFDPRTTGSSGRLGLVYFYYPSPSCTVACPVYAGLSISTDGGATWGRTTTLTPTATNSDWLVQASQGKFLTDYNSVLFPGAGPGPAARALTAFPFALGAPTGGVLSQHMYAISVPVTGPAPATPTGVVATPNTSGAGQATFTFSPGADGGINPTFLAREVSPVPGAHTAIGGASPLVVTGLANGTTYTFEITASNHAGTSAPATVTVTPGSTATTTTTTTTTAAAAPRRPRHPRRPRPRASPGPPPRRPSPAPHLRPVPR